MNIKPQNIDSKFIAFLRDNLDYDQLEHFGQQLDDVRDGVLAHLKKGKLTLTIEFIPKGEMQIKLKPVMKATIPVPEFSDRVSFLDRHGNFTPDNPNQRKFRFEREDGEAAAEPVYHDEDGVVVEDSNVTDISKVTDISEAKTKAEKA